MPDPVTTGGMDPTDRRSHIERINGPKEDGSMLSDAQFAELKTMLTELLTPGYECAKLMLPRLQYEAQMAAQAQQQAPAPETKTE